MVKYEVDFLDYRNGAQSPIDTITANEKYTAADYINDCRKYADNDYIKMLDNGKIILIPID